MVTSHITPWVSFTERYGWVWDSASISGSIPLGVLCLLLQISGLSSCFSFKFINDKMNVLDQFDIILAEKPHFSNLPSHYDQSVCEDLPWWL